MVFWKAVTSQQNFINFIFLSTFCSGSAVYSITDKIAWIALGHHNKSEFPPVICSTIANRFTRIWNQCCWMCCNIRSIAEYENSMHMVEQKKTSKIICYICANKSFRNNRISIGATPIPKYVPILYKTYSRAHKYVDKEKLYYTSNIHQTPENCIDQKK